MSGQLSGRIALITGANRGIGLEIAKEYAREGAECILAGRNLEALQTLAAGFKAAGGKAHAIELDQEDDESIRAATARIARDFPRLDVFIANAASLGARLPIISYPLDVWRQTFQINVHANLLLLQGLDPLLRKSASGRVVFLSAQVATMAKVGTGSYAVSKAALESLARVYMIEGQDTPIRVNTVSPMATRTEMRARAVPAEDPMTLKTPAEIAPLFVELGLASCTLQGEWINADKWLEARKAGRK
ncbi:MAG: SDR family NAD(P)-dependent oxidoreductase [Polaromonas sp.]|nr:SDR family NAD(P)-dependent oxidoreductase [Polaromonas sp.]